jgi:hypothetical protein
MKGIQLLGFVFVVICIVAIILEAIKMVIGFRKKEK